MLKQELEVHEGKCGWLQGGPPYPNIGASRITYTILRVPYYNYTIKDPKPYSSYSGLQSKPKATTVSDGSSRHRLAASSRTTTVTAGPRLSVLASDAVCLKSPWRKQLCCFVQCAAGCARWRDWCTKFYLEGHILPPCFGRAPNLHG